jgi:WD40 repeat protein
VNSWCLKTQLADSGQINFIDWSRDGTKFVTASQTGRVVVYDARTLEQLHVYTGLGGAVNVARFSVNSGMIGIGGANANIHVMRVSDYSIINNSIATSQGSVFQLDFCDGDSYMVSCGNTNFLKLYKISGANIAVIDTSNDTLQKPISCKCSPTSKEVVYGGDKGHGFYLKWRSSNDQFNPNNIPQVLNAILANSLRRGVDYN